MNKAAILLLAIGLMLSLATPVLAAECESMIPKVEAGLQAAELSEEDAQKAEEMLAQGESLCNQGDDEGAMAALNEALAIIQK